jgi:hypothetical protein
MIEMNGKPIEEWKYYALFGIEPCNFSLDVADVFTEYTGTNTEPVTIIMVAMEVRDDWYDINSGERKQKVSAQSPPDLDRFNWLEMDNPAKKPKGFPVPITELDSFNWLTQDICCRYNPEYPKAKIQRYLADHVRKLLIKAGTPKKRYRISRVGNYNIEGEHVFCYGKGVIRSSAVWDIWKDNVDIVLDPMPYNMDVDPNLSEAAAAAGMLELVSLNQDAGRVLMSHTLMYLMRPVYAEAWKAPRCCVFVLGETGKQKTTYTAFMTQLYNRIIGIKDPERLNASIPAAITLLYALDDCTIVLDDLFPSGTDQLKGHQEETMIEITRIIGDGTPPARMQGSKLRNTQPPRQGAVYPGEYLIGSGSTAARILPVTHQQPDRGRLKHFQDNPLIVSTFYRNYLEWYIPKYNEIRDYLKEWANIYFNEVRMGIHDRLQETHYYFNTSYSILLQYCYEKGFISEQDVERLHRSFVGMLTGLVMAQNELTKPTTTYNTSNIDYLAHIRALFKGGELFIADSPEVFVDQVHDGVLHNGCLYLRNKQLGKHFPDADINDVVASLKAQGALKFSKGGRTSQIYALEGMRFYAIWLDKL